MKCKNCSYQFDPLKEGNSKKRKCGMCCFGDSYSIRSKKEYERNLLFAMIESQQYQIDKRLNLIELSTFQSK